MSISKVCRDFDTVGKFFRDELKESKYEFKSTFFKEYCHNNCESDIDKINAGCLQLINYFFIKLGFSADSNTLKSDAVCIIIWLGYILSLKPPDKINTINDFYSSHIENNEEYSKHKINDDKYNNYKKIIDETKEYMNINISNMPKFYKLLKLLCSINTAYTNKNSSQASEHAKKFADEYQKLYDDDNNNEGNSYNKILNVLSNYYNNFGEGTDYNNTSIDRPKLPTKKTPKIVDVENSSATKATGSSSEPNKSDITTKTPSPNIKLSDSSLVNKLIIVLSIFSATLIFFGIAYKYSLFGFRKRSQKQHLREKLKK
ncbi:hypothetical protein YYC_05498 [Plasmodium yoelii 17X]|uniref:Uncharacterized protein n=1 Tax=Plasmodium yoelii 17X TaxID=1323249 RepID=V7PB99_PLAYE|nr:hypothetical protein YYC_05498 [Plasmodium yoelii 17X]